MYEEVEEYMSRNDPLLKRFFGGGVKELKWRLFTFEDPKINKGQWT